VVCSAVLLRMQLLCCGSDSDLVVIGWAGVYNGVALGLCCFGVLMEGCLS
jgi:hypothetical protein